MIFFQLFILFPPFVVLYQFYRYAITKTGIKRERACYALGIVYFSSGTLCFVFRNLYLAFPGLLLLMLGLLLIAQGLASKN